MDHRQLLRPVWAEIDLAAFRLNVQTVSRFIPHSTEIMPVIKADGYGIGATMAARAVRDLPSIAGFAVAIPEEALKLRDDGIEDPILVLGPTTGHSMAFLAYRGVSVAVASLQGVKEARSAANEIGVKVKVHLKIETGMGRVGIMPGDELDAVIREILSGSEIEVEGVFTHFSAADTDSEYTIKQFQTFEQAVAQLESAGVHPRYRHTSNSAAILDFPKSHLDLVRPGILIYGCFPDKSLAGKTALYPVLSLHAQVTHVKNVCAGATIGYGRTYTAPRDTAIATIPIGYADGYPRLLSGKGSVLVHGKRCPIAGRVCMDQMMVEVVPGEVSAGDHVTLIGTDGQKTITVDEVAELAETVPHEILTGLNPRVPRIYIS